MPRERKLRPPTDGGTFPYLSLRSTQPYAEWLYALAAKTHRTTQDLVECSVAEYSQRHGHPCGVPPERTTR
jgi:hypothetical protein